MSAMEWIYGNHPVFEALRAGRRHFHAVYLAKEKSTLAMRQIEDLAHAMKIPVESVPVKQLMHMTGQDVNPGVAAKVNAFPLSDINELPDKNDSPPSLILLLDQIMDPQNFGALVRTALCVGVNGIVITKDRCVQPTPTVSKASAGALEHIKVARVTNLVSTLSWLKDIGFWIAGLDKSASTSIFNHRFDTPLGLVIGSEGKGIRPLVKKQCDLLFNIPQLGPLDSLNASVAGAVVMYEIYRQRHFVKKSGKTDKDT